MATRLFNTIIKSRELADLISQKVPMYILDASYNIPGQTGDSKAEHFKVRLPGAKFFELDEIADKTSGLPHMMPTEATFIDFMKKLRIKNDDKLLVCYDRQGVFTSPRVWYTFKAFGKKNIAVLDGGLPKWISEGEDTESGPYDLYQSTENEKDEDYDYKFAPKMVKNLEDVSTIATLLSFNSPQTLTQIVDARHPKRFLGLEGEPRPDLRSGHIHGSKNLFFRTLFENDNTFKAPEEINKVFEASNVSMKPDEHTIHMCGSGITACINILGMEIAGKKNLSLYDGSWMEWGKNVPDETPNPSVKGMIQQEYAKHEKKRLNIKD